MIENTLQPDVLIVGGGAAGVAAVAGASQSGASVMLIERHAFLGGKATAAMVGTICGAYLRSDQPPRFVMEGFPKIFTEKLRQETGSEPINYKEGLKFLPYDPFVFRYCCDEIVRSKADLFFQSVVSDCSIKNNTIQSIEVVSLDRKLTFFPKAVVDCTGEALVSTLSNLEVLENEEYQAPAIVFSMENLLGDLANLNLVIRREIKKAIDKNELDQVFERISVLPGSVKNNHVYLKIGFPKKISDEINKVSELEIFGRKMIKDIAGFLVKNVSIFANAHVGTVASEVGIRTGKRPRGKYILTEEDVLSCRKFEDGITNGAWPVEYWGNEKSVKMTYFTKDDFYQIPSGCLQSKDLQNLFFAGRNISATEKAIASARVIGTCLGTGFAAGKMAAFQGLGKPLENAILEIRKEQMLL